MLAQEVGFARIEASLPSIQGAATGEKNGSDVCCVSNNTIVADHGLACTAATLVNGDSTRTPLARLGQIDRRIEAEKAGQVGKHWILDARKRPFRPELPPKADSEKRYGDSGTCR